MYSQILVQSFKKIWRNKLFWIMGLFASFIGTAEEAEFLRNSSIRGGRAWLGDFWLNLKASGLFSTHGLQGMIKTLKTDPIFFFQILFFLVLTLSIIGVLMWLAIISQGGMVLAAGKPADQKNQRLSTLLKPGIKKIIPLASINVLGKGVSVMLFIAMTSALKLSPVLSIPLTLILAGGMLAVFAVIKYSVCEVMLNKNQLLGSVTSAINLVLRTWWPCLKFSLTLVALNILVTTLLLVGILILFIPFLLIIAASFIIKFTFGVIFTFLVFLTLAFFIFMVTLGLLSALSWMAWTEFYLAPRQIKR